MLCTLMLFYSGSQLLCVIAKKVQEGLACRHEGDARRKFRKQPLKVTNMGVAPACSDL